MQASRVRRAVAVVALLGAVLTGSAVLAAGGALFQEDDGESSASEDAASEGAAVDAERVNVTLALEPAADGEEDVDYELAVVGEIEAANDAADDTVECTDELCVVDGTLASDAGDDERPEYRLRGVVTGVEPADGITTRINGTLEGDALQGLGLGAYNATGDEPTAGEPAAEDGDADASGGDVAGTEDLTFETGDADAVAGEGSNELVTDGGTVQSDTEGESRDGDADDESADGGAETETDDEDAETSDEDAETSDEDAETSDEDAETDPADDSATDETGDDSTDDAEASDGVSITFDGCSSATVEGDAHAYEAGLAYYLPDGFDTSTRDESDVSTPVTIDGEAEIGDGTTSDVVVEDVLVLDEDFGVLEHRENPDREECLDRIERQHEEGTGDE